MTDDAVLLERDGRIATLTLNHPDRLNALSVELLDALGEHIDILEAENLGSLVVEGAGRAFSAGGDIERLHDNLDREEPTDHIVREFQQRSGRIFEQLVDFPAPTIAKIDGPAVGAGASLAVACDLLLASTNGSIGFAFRNVGLAPDSGVSYMLPRMVGTNVAKELVYTGEILDADRAEDLGLFNHVYPAESFDDDASELIEDIASGPTVALRNAKRLIADGVTKTFGEAVSDEWTAQGTVFQTDDHREGLEAFLEDRDPEFEGR